jgi:hypothetical protein
VHHRRKNRQCAVGCFQQVELLRALALLECRRNIEVARQERRGRGIASW